MSKRNNQDRRPTWPWPWPQATPSPTGPATTRSPRRTAYTWSRCPEVTEAVEHIRREVLDRAIGRLSNNATAVADRIAKLALEAAAESVQLSACRAVLAELMTISNYAAIERRLAQVERHLRDGATTTVPGPEPDSEPESATDEPSSSKEEVRSCPA